MSEVDIVKETIAYLKFWLGAMVVSDITLVGWLLSNTDLASNLKIVSAAFGVVVITVFALIMHKRIEFLILKLKEL